MLDELKEKAGDLAGKAEELLKRQDVQEKLAEAKDKAEDFVFKKTNGKGILGFGDGK